jgi:phospholipid/cholesterol/gamma-HCH transport system permease protein
VGNFLNLLGALDRLGGLFVIIVMREFAPLVCAIVMAGVAGTAMTADLGARKIREELDALMVLGVEASLVKSTIFGALIAIVCCYKG